MPNQDLRIIVVDDFPMARFVLKRALTGLGVVNIDEADDGAAGEKMVLAALEAGKPYHLVVSDWNMPVMDGLTFLSNLRQNKALGTVPFILVTAETEDQNVEMARQLNVSGYVKKPFMPDAIRAYFEEFFASHFSKLA